MFEILIMRCKNTKIIGNDGGAEGGENGETEHGERKAKDTNHAPRDKERKGEKRW